MLTFFALPAALADDSELEVGATPVVAPAPPPPPASPWPSWVQVIDVRVSGYVQPQAVFSELSEDALTADGTALNADRFTLRRGRLRVDRDFKYAHATVEFDGNTSYGPAVSVKRVEASIRYPGPGEVPFAQLTGGLTEIPFGYELTESNRDRLAMERTLGSRAFFLGEYDVGVRLHGGLGPLRYAAAVLNGVPASDNPSADDSVYTAQKTIVGRLGAEAGKQDTFELGGGVSALKGAGFHAGTPATKSSLTWDDANQDGLVSLAELTATNGQAATESSTFDRWAVNGDLEAGVHTPIGWTRLRGEVTMAANLDRGLYVADPISTGFDVRELAWTASVQQDVTRYATLGFRVDSYDGNADLFESRRGEFLPLDVSVLTLSPVVALQLPHLVKLSVQYDYVVDHLGRDVNGEPIDLPNDQWTVRGQVEF